MIRGSSRSEREGRGEREDCCVTPDGRLVERGRSVDCPPLLSWLVWALLASLAVGGLLMGRFTVTFVALGTLVLTLAPIFVERLLHVDIPAGFSVGIVMFLIATLILGELGDFYERFWWWDVVLHAGSAIGFGLAGVILMRLLLCAGHMRAAPGTAAFFAFCFAMMIGAVWEIWEFTLDQVFGLNTQKSGLVDTMWDLIVDAFGGGVGAAAGYAYLKGWSGGPLTQTIREFVRRNPRLFGRADARSVR